MCKKITQVAANEQQRVAKKGREAPNDAAATPAPLLRGMLCMHARPWELNEYKERCIKGQK